MNTLAAEILYNTIGELAQVDLETVVLDVCCGTGTIGLSLAKVEPLSVNVTHYIIFILP